MKGISPDEERLALARLLGISELGNAIVTTPEMLLTATQWLLAKIRNEIAERPISNGQEWGRIADICRLYGVKRSQANKWVQILREQGKIRTGNAPVGIKGKGDTLYSLLDMEKAFAENSMYNVQ